ncbi:MAG: hypothetical protein K8H87_08500 [Pseudorhodoplanes sp.]|nr:hypothetical protein [Pseudorhodoplanes sp.]
MLVLDFGIAAAINRHEAAPGRFGPSSSKAPRGHMVDVLARHRFCLMAAAARPNARRPRQTSRHHQSMIPEGVKLFSEKVMLEQGAKAG